MASGFRFGEHDCLSIIAGFEVFFGNNIAFIQLRIRTFASFGRWAVFIFLQHIENWLFQSRNCASSAIVEFENGARGVFETSRSIVGPQSQCAFEVYGTKGSLAWNLETMNELQLFLTKDAARGYTTVYSGDRYPYHGHFVPGDANPIGYEDLKSINERLIYLAITGFGPTGPYSERPTYDPIAQGLVGGCYIQGMPFGGRPQLIQSAIVDKTTAHIAAGIAVSALYARDRQGGTGRGQRVDVPMIDSWAAASATASSLISMPRPGRSLSKKCPPSHVKKSSGWT